MIQTACDEYRGWAKRARDLQQQSQQWTTLAMAFAVLAAILGAAAGQADTGVWWGRVLAFLAAACAAIVPVLGQDVLSVGREAARDVNWYARYLAGGPEALADRPSRPDRVWNRIPDAQRMAILTRRSPNRTCRPANWRSVSPSRSGT